MHIYFVTARNKQKKTTMGLVAENLKAETKGTRAKPYHNLIYLSRFSD